MKYTPRIVAERLHEAANTLKRLPMTGLKPQGYKSSWPEYLCDVIPDGDRPKVAPPSGAAIKRMDECLDWLLLLKPEIGKIVWLRAEGTQWKIIMRQCGICRTIAWSYWINAMEELSITLNISTTSKKNVRR